MKKYLAKLMLDEKGMCPPTIYVIIPIFIMVILFNILFYLIAGEWFL